MLSQTFLHAADLKNEPHGMASWGDGNPRTDWRLATQRIAAAIHAANPKLLIFVEGVSGNCHRPISRDAGWWGGCLCAAGHRWVRRILHVHGELSQVVQKEACCASEGPIASYILVNVAYL